MTARGASAASLALIWYEIHAEMSNRHAGPIRRPANRRVARHLNATAQRTTVS